MLLSIGTIIVIDKDFTKDSEKFKSKVVDIGDGFVMIDYPTHIETGRTAFFMDGTQLHRYIHRQYENVLCFPD